MHCNFAFISTWTIKVTTWENVCILKQRSVLCAKRNWGDPFIAVKIVPVLLVRIGNETGTNETAYFKHVNCDFIVSYNNYCWIMISLILHCCNCVWTQKTLFIIKSPKFCHPHLNVCFEGKRQTHTAWLFKILQYQHIHYVNKCSGRKQLPTNQPSFKKTQV